MGRLMRMIGGAIGGAVGGCMIQMAITGKQFDINDKSIVLYVLVGIVLSAIYDNKDTKDGKK